MNKEKALMVFDVESLGLYGSAFAYGFVVVDKRWKVVCKGYESYDPRGEEGWSFVGKDTQEWLLKNVFPALESDYLDDGKIYTVESLFSLRESFFSMYDSLRNKYDLTVWADCKYPVETNFLNDVFKADERNFLGPYPFHDIATMILATNRDPLAANKRLDGENPAHHPLADSIQSLRLLKDCYEAMGIFF